MTSPRSTSAPTQAATPSPGPSARPTLAYPDVQSYGTITVSFTSPAIEPLTIGLACEWSSPTEVVWLYPSDPVAFHGEKVSIDLLPRAPGSGQFRIGRDGAAGYDATETTGDVHLVDATSDGASGSIRFDAQVAGPRDRRTRTTSIAARRLDPADRRRPRDGQPDRDRGVDMRAGPGHRPDAGAQRQRGTHSNGRARAGARAP